MSPGENVHATAATERTSIRQTPHCPLRDSSSQATEDGEPVDAEGWRAYAVEDDSYDTP